MIAKNHLARRLIAKYHWSRRAITRKPWPRRLITATGGITLAFIALKALALLTPTHDGPESDHFDGRYFSNIPADRTIDKSFFEILRWYMTREPGPWSEKQDTVYFTPPQTVQDGLRVTFVNHATILIQTGGLNILTDPIWSQRTGPFDLFGPARYRDPGIRFADLPPIDIVLISHNHYDHLDIDSLADLAEKYDPEFLVPLGNTRYLRRAGITNITEMDWWQSEWFEKIEIHAVPAQHWSRRGVSDTNHALWSGYVIMSDAGPVYFAGDTGMSSHFSEISARLGAPRLAMLPIGAYQPRWFMAEQHVNPAEVVSAHIMMGTQESMAIHFGTFQLGDDGQDEPVRDLEAAIDLAEIDESQFWIPGNGESRTFEPINEPIARIVAR